MDESHKSKSKSPNNDLNITSYSSQHQHQHHHHHHQFVQQRRHQEAPTQLQLSINPSSNTCDRQSLPSYLLPEAANKRSRSLVNLCLGVLGRHLDDILDELGEIAELFPFDIKLKLLAIARRRGLLCDRVLHALIDNSWDKLDLSGSEVTDIGLEKVAEICRGLKAVDISRCNLITSKSICALLRSCRLLETLRCGGTPLSDVAARRSLDFLKPRLNEVEEDNWEDLESKEIGTGVQSLRWLIWPCVDGDSSYVLSTECPKIILNPPTHRYKGQAVPKEALPGIVLDEFVVEDIDPTTWAINATAKLRALTAAKNSEPGLLSKAELFRLAFHERDERLAPKRAKNVRQHQRRAEKEFIESNNTAKSLFLATSLQKSLRR